MNTEFLFLEGGTEVLLQELGTSLEELNAPSLKDKITALTEKCTEEGLNDLAEELISSLPGLFSQQFGEKDWEGVFYQVLALLSVAPAQKQEERIEQICKVWSTEMDVERGGSLKLKMLTTLHNLLKPGKAQLEVLKTIAKFCEKAQQPELLLGVLSYLQKTTQVRKSEKVKLYAEFAEILRRLSLEKEAIRLEQQLIQWSGAEADPAITARVVKHLLQNPEYFGFEDLNSWPAVKAAFPSDTVIGTLLQQLTCADLSGSVDFLQSIDSIEGVDKEGLLFKVRLLKLAALGQRAQHQHHEPIPYTVVASTLQVPVDQVEHWMIDGIQSGLIEARMNQITEQVTITRAKHLGSFGEAEWRLLEQRLTGWKENLSGVLQVMQQQQQQQQQRA